MLRRWHDLMLHHLQVPKSVTRMNIYTHTYYLICIHYVHASIHSYIYICVCVCAYLNIIYIHKPPKNIRTWPRS